MSLLLVASLLLPGSLYAVAGLIAVTGRAYVAGISAVVGNQFVAGVIDTGEYREQENICADFRRKCDNKEKLSHEISRKS